MAYTVSLPGANNTTIFLNYNEQQTAIQAQNIATALTNLLAGGASIDTVPAGVSFAAPQLGVQSILEITSSGANVQVKGFEDIVDSASGPTTISSSDGLSNKSILFGSGPVTVGANGSGTIVGGDGNDKLNLSGDWVGYIGDGNDTVALQGTAIFHIGHGSDLFIGNGGSHTVFGGGGAATLKGGNAGDKGFVYFGTDGTKITDLTSTDDRLVAASGNETLNAAKSTGNVTFDVQGGNSTLVGGHGSDVFSFANDVGGSNVTIFDFTSLDKLNLGNNTITGESQNKGSLTITLSDKTVITFSDISKLH